MPSQQLPFEQPRNRVRTHADQRVDQDGKHDDIGAQELARIHREKADA
jgi:hypothetical protein